MIYKLILLVAIALNIVGQTLLKKIVSGLDSQPVIQQKIMSVAGNPLIWVALFTYGMGFVLYLAALSKMNLGIAYPIASVATIVAVLAISFFYFQETLSTANLVGVSLCVVGILLLLK